MNPMARHGFLLATSVLLGACSFGDSGDTDTVFRHISIRNDTVVVHAMGTPDAIIDPAGALSIDGKSVQTTPAQREQLLRYRTDALTLRGQAVAVGKAGIRTAGGAIGSVIAGLASGQPDTIGPKVEARAEEVRAGVQALCTTLRDLGAAQDAIAAELPGFRPYATIKARDIDDCH